MADEAKIPDAPRTPDAPLNEASGADPEEIPLTVTERSLMRRLSSALRFADFMALLMVAATAFSAFASWRMAQLTNLLFSVSERPYIGMQRVAFDSVDATSARVLIDCRNFGTMSANDAVARIHLLVNERPLAAANDLHDTTINIGNFTPSVPHPFHRFLPIKVYDAAREGRAKLVVYVQITYRGPDQRQFCYNETMTYDNRADTFDPNGGNDRCDGEIF